MNRLVAVLSIVIILLSAVCGILYSQIGDMESQIADLENQTSVLEGQISEYQNQTSQLENQINELETQLDDLEAQNLELQNQKRVLEIESTNWVRIKEFRVAGWNSFGGTAAISDVNVTVQNFGVNAVDGLTLSVMNSPEEDIPHAKEEVGLLKSGEARIISTYVVWGFQSEIKTFIAVLMFDDVILDESTTSLIN